jgi:hypothetical protein
MMPTLVMDDRFAGLFLFSISLLFSLLHFSTEDGHQDVIVSGRFEGEKWSRWPPQSSSCALTLRNQNTLTIIIVGRSTSERGNVMRAGRTIIIIKYRSQGKIIRRRRRRRRRNISLRQPCREHTAGSLGALQSVVRFSSTSKDFGAVWKKRKDDRTASLYWAHFSGSTPENPRSSFSSSRHSEEEEGVHTYIYVQVTVVVTELRETIRVICDGWWWHKEWEVWRWGRGGKTEEKWNSIWKVGGGKKTHQHDGDREEEEVLGLIGEIKKMPFIHSRGYCCVCTTTTILVGLCFFFLFLFFYYRVPATAWWRSIIPSSLYTYCLVFAGCVFLFFYDSDRIIL